MVNQQLLIIAAASLTGLCVVVAALLRGWGNWLALKKSELDRVQEGTQESAQDQGSPIGAARIEIADLKERIRKLEAIASGVDL
ncbi:hypothetical protein N8940_02280 [Sphingomonadaceae bacterium]|nr:hypothetical protein [Sphingomonadaceae bacterium]